MLLNTYLSDATGKLFELEFAKHLDTNKKYPIHYRDEKGKNPEDVVNHSKERLGEQAAKNIDYNAQYTANEYRTFINNPAIYNIAWVSQPSDHEKHTGDADTNSTADIMFAYFIEGVLTTRGVSLKYGRHPGSRNPGILDMARMAEFSSTTVLNNIIDFEHLRDKYLHFIEGETLKEKHRHYKAITAFGEHSEAVAAVKNASKNLRVFLALGLTNAFNNSDSSHRATAIRRLLGADATLYPFDLVHVDSKHQMLRISTPSVTFDCIDEKCTAYTAEHYSTTIRFYGEIDGKKEKLVCANIKHTSSSPFTSIKCAAHLGVYFRTSAECSVITLPSIV
jgi:hypothetical protein